MPLLKVETLKQQTSSSFVGVVFMVQSLKSMEYIHNSYPTDAVENNVAERVFMIGISGGSASGKTSVADRVIQSINLPNVVLVSMDSFYRVLSPEESRRAKLGEYNFDSPEAFDLPYLEECLGKLKNGIPVEIPEYDFCTHSRTANSTRIVGSSVVVFEGIMALYPTAILPLLDLKVFVDTDDDVRLARRLVRDIAQRGRSQDSVLEMYFKFAKAGYDNYIAPSARNADLVIPRGGDNEVAINLLIKHVRQLLAQRGLDFDSPFPTFELGPECTLPVVNASTPEQTKALRSYLTVISNPKANAQTLKDAFDAILSLLIEHALAINSLNVNPEQRTDICVLCPEHMRRIGSESLQHYFSRSSLTFLNLTKGSKLNNVELPSAIDSAYVFVFDTHIATGTTALRVIELLIKHRVQQERIIFIAVLCTLQGLQAIQREFPQVRIVCAKVASIIDKRFAVQPALC